MGEGVDVLAFDKAVVGNDVECSAIVPAYAWMWAFAREAAGGISECGK